MCNETFLMSDGMQRVGDGVEHTVLCELTSEILEPIAEAPNCASKGKAVFQSIEGMFTVALVSSP